MNDHDQWFDSMLQTLKASRWQLFKARLFGRRVIGEDLGHKCAGHQYRGVLYLTDFQKG